MYGLASFAVAGGALSGWSRTLFEVYWVLGAVLNVPLLAAGEMHLLRRGQVLDVAVWVVLAFVFAYTVAVTRGAAIDPSALAEQLPSGKEVFGDGTAAYRLPQLLRPLVRDPSRRRGVVGLADARAPGAPEPVIGTLLVAAGATITAAAGSAFAAVGNLPAFSLSLLAGVAVMFLGFRRASDPAPRPNDAIFRRTDVSRSPGPIIRPGDPPARGARTRG